MNRMISGADYEGGPVINHILLLYSRLAENGTHTMLEVRQRCVETQSPTRPSDAVLNVVIEIDNFPNSIKLSRSSNFLEATKHV